MRAPAALDEGHSAMTAGVAETPRPPVAATNRAQRRPEADAFDMVAGVRDGRRRNEHAGKPTQHPYLIGESSGVEVGFDRLSPCLTFVGRSRVDMSEHAAHYLHIVCDQRLCGRIHGAPPGGFDGCTSAQ